MSGANLNTPEGTMRGGFNMVVLRDGNEVETFYAAVDPFALAVEPRPMGKPSGGDKGASAAG